MKTPTSELGHVMTPHAEPLAPSIDFGSPAQVAAGPALEDLLAGLFSLASSHVVELCRLLDAVLDSALELTASDAGGAICLRNPDSPPDLRYCKVVGGVLKGTTGTLAQLLPGSCGRPEVAGAGGRIRRFRATETSYDDHACFERSRSAVRVSLSSAGLAQGAFQVEATRAGAYPRERLAELAELGRCASLLIERLLLKEHAAGTGLDLYPVGRSEKFLELERLLKQIAADPSSPVLIRGERGSGKELAAYAIHYFGSRRDRPFVAVNSASLTNGLAADELFGHGRGAFTGAESLRQGLFRSADKGSLFFDEVGDMALDVQASLLRALEYGEIRHIGCDEPLRVDVRVIAATNHDLERLIERGKFRSDLYDRLNVFQVRVPPLRERPDDVPLLTDYFLRRGCLKNGRKHWMEGRSDCATCLRSGDVRCALPGLYQALAGCHFPGNVRELRNVITRLATTVHEELHPEHLASAAMMLGGGKPVVGRNGNGNGNGDLRLASVIRAHMEDVLEKAGGNKSAAARALGLPLTTMINKMKKLGID